MSPSFLSSVSVDETSKFKLLGTEAGSGRSVSSNSHFVSIKPRRSNEWHRLEITSNGWRFIIDLTQRNAPDFIGMSDSNWRKLIALVKDGGARLNVAVTLAQHTMKSSSQMIVLSDIISVSVDLQSLRAGVRTVDILAKPIRFDLGTIDQISMTSS